MHQLLVMLYINECYGLNPCEFYQTWMYLKELVRVISLILLYCRCSHLLFIAMYIHIFFLYCVLQVYMYVYNEHVFHTLSFFCVICVHVCIYGHGRAASD